MLLLKMLLYYTLIKQHNQNINVNDARLRRTCLENLCIELIKPQIEKRALEAEANNYAGFSSKLIESFARTGVNIIKKPIRERTQSININNQHKPGSPSTKKRGRCVDVCTKTDNKMADTCSHCEGFVCKIHSEQLKTVICRNCVYS